MSVLADGAPAKRQRTDDEVRTKAEKGLELLGIFAASLGPLMNFSLQTA